MMELTPLDVRKKKGDFRRVLRGYDSGVVDDFMDLVADRMEELVRVAASQKESVTRLEQQVADYRDREKALTEALVSAQEMREEIRSQSTREVDLLRRQAEQEAQQIRGEAVRAREREEESLNTLRTKQLQFLSSYRSFLEQELADLAAHARGLELQAGLPARAPATAAARPTPRPPVASAPVAAAREAAFAEDESEPVAAAGSSAPSADPGSAAPAATAAAAVPATAAPAVPDYVAARSPAAPGPPASRSPEPPPSVGAAGVEDEVDVQVGAALEEWGTEFDGIASEAPDLILSDADVVADNPEMFFGDEPDDVSDIPDPAPGPEFEPEPVPEPKAIDDSAFHADVTAAFGGAGGGHDDLLDLESFDSLRGPDAALGESIVGPPPVIPPDQLTISPVFLERAEPDRESGEPGDEGEARAPFSPMFEDDG